MKFQIATKINLDSAITLIAITATTLIMLPMSVFAQSDINNSQILEMQTVEDGVQSATSSVIEVQKEAPTALSDKYYDTYERQELPASSKTFNDFVVGPGRYEIEVAPGETKTVLLNISNRLGGGRLFQFSTEDMDSSDDGLGANTRLLGDSIGPYTIKDYIDVPYNRFYLENNQRAVVPVTISIPADAEPGGFYGSILTEVLPEIRNVDDGDVSPTAPVINRIGTLFYVTTPGDIDHAGSLIDLTTIPDKSIYFSGPVNMGMVYENTGSVHITPYGELEVTNLLGDTVGQVEILPWFVMPSSVRTREVLWNREFLIGRYTATAYINRGYEDKIDTQSVIFWVLPWKFLSTVFAGVFIFFLSIRFLVRNFEFKMK